MLVLMGNWTRYTEAHLLQLTGEHCTHMFYDSQPDDAQGGFGMGSNCSSLIKVVYYTVQEIELCGIGD